MCAVLGASVSSLTASLLYNNIGRFYSLIIIMLLEIFVNSLYIIPNIHLLYILRFSSGYIFNFYTFICSIYLKEILPYKFKKIFSNYYPLFFGIGLIVGYSFGKDIFI